MSAGPEGYTAKDLGKYESRRRVRDAPWFALCGRMRRGISFKICARWEGTMPGSGALHVFANDAWLMYFNNRGEIRVTVELAED